MPTPILSQDSYFGDGIEVSPGRGTVGFSAPGDDGGSLYLVSMNSTTLDWSNNMQKIVSSDPAADCFTKEFKFWSDDKVIIIKTFEESYDELVIWIEKSGKKPSAGSKDKTEKRLGYFCGSRRQDKKKGKLDQNKIDKLEKIDGWFWQ